MSSLETLEGLWKARPGGLVFASYAESLQRAGRAEEAQGVLDEGVRRWPRHLAGRLVQGAIARDRGDVEGARSAFQTAVDLDGSCRSALEGLAEASARGQYFRQAFESWSLLASLEPDHPQAADRARAMAQKLDSATGFDAVATVREDEDERSREALSEGASSQSLATGSASTSSPAFRLDLADIPAPSLFAPPHLDGPTIPDLLGFQLPTSFAAPLLPPATAPAATSSPSLTGKLGDSSFATLEMPSFPSQVIPPPPLELPRAESQPTEPRLSVPGKFPLSSEDMEAEATQFIATRPAPAEKTADLGGVTGQDVSNRLDEVFGSSSHEETQPAPAPVAQDKPGRVTGNDVKDRLGQLFGDSSISAAPPLPPPLPVIADDPPTVESVPVVASSPVVSGEDIEDRLDDLFGESVLDLTGAQGRTDAGDGTSAMPREEILSGDVPEHAGEETSAVVRDTTFEARLAVDPPARDPGADSTAEMRVRELKLGRASQYIEQAIQGSEIDPTGSTIDLPAIDVHNSAVDPVRSARLTTDDVDSRLDELFASSEFVDPPQGGRSGFAPRPVPAGQVGTGVTGDDIEGRLDDLFGEDSDFPAGLPTVTFAEEYLRQGHPEQAASIYRQLLDKDPGNAELRRRLSEIEGRG